MTIKELLNNNKDVKNHLKEMTLMHLLSEDKNYLIINSDLVLKEDLIIKYNNLIKEIIMGKPLQYVLNSAYFYNEEFYVNENVLIPRPETEYLVKETYELIKKKFNKDISILDIGTGSGVIAITLKRLLKTSNVTGLDISNEALEIAKINDKNKEIEFINSNLFSNINSKYDVIISNPPYIDINIKADYNVHKYEPHLALYANNKGLHIYENILKDISNYLNKEFIIAFEIGNNQSKDLEILTKKYLSNIKTISKKDLNGFDRYFFIINE